MSSPHIPLEEDMWQSGEEVIQITSSGGYVNFDFLKITAPLVFNQRFEPGTLGSEATSQRPPIDPMQTHVA